MLHVSPFQEPRVGELFRRLIHPWLSDIQDSLLPTPAPGSSPALSSTDRRDRCRRKHLVDGLPDGSLVVYVADHVKYLSAGEPLAPRVVLFPPRLTSFNHLPPLCLPSTQLAKILLLRMILVPSS